MHRFIVRTPLAGAGAYVINMPGLSGTPEVMARFNALLDWQFDLDFIEYEADFPRVYVTYRPEDEKTLLEDFSDIVAMSPEEYLLQPTP